MASLRKVLEKAGYLNPTAINLQKFIDKQNQRSNQTQFNELMQTAVGEIMRSGTEQTEEPSFFTPGNRLGEDLSQTLVNPTSPEAIDEVPDDLILGDITDRQRTPDEQRMNIQKSQFDALLKASQIEGLDPEIFRTGAGLLDLLGESKTPQGVGREYKSVALGSDLIEISDDGTITVVRPGTQKAKTERSLGSYTDKSGKHRITLYDPETQTTREIVSEKKVRPPRGLKIDFPEPDKWRNFGSVMNGIYYKTDQDGNILETTPQEQKILRDLAQNKVLGNILPGAISFMQQRIWNAWNRENMSQTDFEEEIKQGLDSGELSPEEAQDLIDYNQFRPFLYDDLIETVERNPEE